MRLKVALAAEAALSAPGCKPAQGSRGTVILNPSWSSSAQDLVTIFCDPHNVILYVPHRMPAMSIVHHVALL